MVTDFCLKGGIPSRSKISQQNRTRFSVIAPTPTSDPGGLVVCGDGGRRGCGGPEVGLAWELANRGGWMLMKAQGWHPGLIALDLTKAIQQELGVGLIEARRLSHAIVDNESVDFEFESPEMAARFREKLRVLGVITQEGARQ